MCVECQHGKSKHPKPTVSTAALVLQPWNGNKEILQIFNQATRGDGASTVKATHKAATAEVMEGYRPETAEGSTKKIKVDSLH
jgi:hypothetical protein